MALTMPVAIFEQDASLRYSWIRDPYAIFDVESSLGKTDEEFFSAAEASVLTGIKRMVLDSVIGAREVVHVTGAQGPVTVEMLVGPLISNDGEVIGVIGTLRALGADSHGLVEGVQPSRAHIDHQEMLRLMGRDLADMRDQERERLLRGFHDLLGPSLTALNLELGTLAIHLDVHGMDQKAADLLDDARSLTEELGENVRNMMMELQPQTVGEDGLISRLEIHRTAFAQRTGIAVILQNDSFPALPPNSEDMLFRIIREAFTNAARHSGASHITVSLTTDGDKACVAIADDGRGFDVERGIADSRQRSWGLITMKERAVAAGGQLHIESTPGEGATIIVEIFL